MSSPETETKHGLTCDSIQRPHSIFGRAVCLSLHPGRMILFPLREWFKRRYQGKYKYDRIIFSFDLILVGVIITLTSLSGYFFLFPHKNFEDKISFTATVAPHEIVTGAPSTLVIQYHNGTKEILRHAKLNIAFPDHFLLQDVSVNSTNVTEHNIDLGDIAVGATGDVHVKGVMFGDVGGKQTFESSMTFVHGTKTDTFGSKVSAHEFSPVHSTLQLTLTLPDRIIASQPIEGIIRYKNTGTIDFPEIRIEPEWPKGFTLSKASASFVNNTFAFPRIKAGTEGILTFNGFLGDVPDQVDFIFHPSFTFGKDHYKQETLTQSVPVLPAQIKLDERIETNTFKPGTDATVIVHYKHVGTETLHDLEIGIVSDNPFITSGGKTVTAKEYPALKLLKPGDEGDIHLVIPIRSTVPQNTLRSFSEIQIHTQTIARYTMESNLKQRLTTNGEDVATKLITPINFESFARYATPSGDQIGRGPLPPRVDQKTSYWIFWNVDGTTNTIDHVAIEGVLPDNVAFTGRETSSEDGGVSYDPDTHKIHWDTSSIPPTLDPASKIFSVAFEVVVTPNSSQIGTNPVLIKEIHLTGNDTFTGAFVSASASNITTKLPTDSMAKGKSAVK